MKNVFTPQDVEQDPILQAKDVAQWLEVNPDKIAAWKRKGRLPRYEFGLPKKAKSWRLSTLLNHDAFESCSPEKKKAEIAFLKSISQKKTEIDFLKGVIRELARTLHALQSAHPARHKARLLFSKVSDLGLLHEAEQQKEVAWQSEGV